MKYAWWLALALLISPIASAQEIEKVQPKGPARRGAIVFAPMRVAHEAGITARDFATFRNTEWSLLTLAQIGAASADAATSLDNLHHCPICSEEGISRYFVGRHPDAHKYLIGGAIEIGVEAVAAHYFRSHGPARKWYWKALWTLPQSLSLYEHAQAASHNAGLHLSCLPSAPGCR